MSVTRSNIMHIKKNFRCGSKFLLQRKLFLPARPKPGRKLKVVLFGTVFAWTAIKFGVKKLTKV